MSHNKYNRPINIKNVLILSLVLYYSFLNILYSLKNIILLRTKRVIILCSPPPLLTPVGYSFHSLPSTALQFILGHSFHSRPRTPLRFVLKENLHLKYGKFRNILKKCSIPTIQSLWKGKC